MDDRESPTNSMMKSAASLMMDDDIHEIEEGANTSTNASPRPSCITPGRQALADSIMESVKASVSKLRRGDRPTIYIVPQRIREVKEVAYEPKMVSIGPYHHGKKRLQAMEEHKLLYLHSFLSRNPNHQLEDYLKAMEELEDKARSCYSDNIGPNEFVKMMVLDACFIIELFLRLFPREQIEELFRQQRDLSPPPEVPEFFFHSNGFEDPIFDMTGTVEYTVSDTLLFENQIPFFVLQRIFIMACPANVPHLLAKMAHYLFDGFMARNKKIEIKDSYHHLLHLFHLHLLPTPTIRKEVPNLSLTIYEPREMIPCATDLQHAGVKFKKNEKSNNILNVKFSNGVLEITPFVIHDQSDTLFRNLIAFEQCCLEAKFHVFTTYLVFMDYLVNTSKDVALLHQNGIMDNFLGSDDDVALLFNRLRIGIFHNFKGSYLSDVHDNVQKHCENKCNMWRASLKRDYFTNPWSFISLIAASILLLLTITQTFFTVFPYF